MDELFISVLNMSLTASYVIAAIILARLFLKKAPKVISYILWAVVGFRLTFPFSFESVFSLIPFQSAPIPADIAIQPIPRVDSGINLVDNTVSRVLPVTTPGASVNPLQIWQTVGVYIWLTGISVMLIYSVVSIVLLKRQLYGSALTEGNIYEAGNLKTPFVLGFIHPKIYIPAGLSAEEKGYIILHEQTHIKRFDYVVKLAAFIILCIHWFNPLVWVAFLLMSMDMEMSCDERVLKEMGSHIKKAYSASLLSMATGRQLINSSPLAFGEGNLRGRIKNVLNFKKPAFWVLAAAIIVAIAVGIGLLCNPISSTSSLEWAKSLTSANVQSIELVVVPSNENEQYRKYGQDEFPGIVNLIRQSHGSLVKNPEQVTGGTQTIYITTQDGLIHEVSNIGNQYLIIDGDSFDAGHNWLGGWKFSGNAAVPEGFWERVKSTSAQNQGALRPDYDFSLLSVNGVGFYAKAEAIDMSLWTPAEPLNGIDSYQYNYKEMRFDVDETGHLKRFFIPTPTSVRINSVDIYSRESANSATMHGGITIEQIEAVLGKGDVSWQDREQKLRYERYRDENRNITVTFVYTDEDSNGALHQVAWISADQFLKPHPSVPADSPELIAQADVDWDGAFENIYLDKSQIEERSVTLRVFDKLGKELWSERLSTAHSGWDSLFLYELDGKQYLLRYNPSMYQGYCEYMYTVFTLEGGKEKVFRTNTLVFDINGAKALDAPKMIAFADEVNALLNKSILLISSENSAYSFGPSAAEQFFEMYSWLDSYPKLYAGGDDLETRLKKYSDYTVSNRKISEGTVFIATEKEVVSAKEAALSYYKNTVFKGRVTNISQITDVTKFKSAVIPHNIKDVVVAFYATISDGAKRMIVLTKEKGGEWEVINEGV